MSSESPQPSVPVPFDPPANRSHHRLVTAYATSYVYRGAVDRSLGLYLGRLSAHYEAAADSFPAWVFREAAAGAVVSGPRTGADETECQVSKVSFGAMACPDDRLVLAIAVDIECQPLRCISLLEDLYYRELTLDGRRIMDVLEERCAAIATSAGAPATELHQLALLSTAGDVALEDETFPKLVYRADLPNRSGLSAIEFPNEMNRNTYTAAAVGPYVSVLAGQQDYVENAAFTSAVLITNAAARLREIKTDMRQQYEEFTNICDRSDIALVDRSRSLATIRSRLAGLELDLSFRVESHLDIGVFIPSLRPDSFHDSLARSTKLVNRSQLVAGALERLEDAVHSEAMAVSARIQADEAHSRQTWELTVTALTTVALPIGGLLAFFGISAREVDPEASLFDFSRYGMVYLVTAALVLVSMSFVLVRRRQTPSRTDVHTYASALDQAVARSEQAGADARSPSGGRERSTARRWLKG